MENLFDWYRPESKWLEKHGQVSSNCSRATEVSWHGPISAKLETRLRLLPSLPPAMTRLLRSAITRRAHGPLGPTYSNKDSPKR